MDDTSLDDFLNADGEESSDETTDADETDSPSDVGAAASETEDEETESDEGQTDDETEREETENEVNEEIETGKTGDGNTETEADTDAEPDQDVEPARSTMTFSPDGGECAACGERVGRRWSDGDSLVCRGCKEW